MTRPLPARSGLVLASPRRGAGLAGERGLGGSALLRLGLFLGDGAVNGAFYPLEGLSRDMSAVAATASARTLAGA